MDIRNSSRWVQYTLGQQWLGMLGITLAAFAFRSFLHPLIQPYGVFHFFIVAVLLVQYLFGYRLALASIVISLALGEVYFVEPYGEVSHLTDKDLIISLNFVLVILPAVFLLEKLQRTLYARQLLNKVNNSRMLVALRRENDRLYFSKKIDQSNDFIQTLLQHFDQLVLVKTHEHPAMKGPALMRVCRQLGVQDTWQNLLSQEDLEEIHRPLKEPDWQAKRWERDFKWILDPQGSAHPLQGKVISFQIHDLQAELWIEMPS
jgi:K+-sensing histidine kinase KdpD